MRRFLQELKRRNVYRVAATYAAVAFVTLQAASLLFPATTLKGVYDPLVVVAFVGFPIAVVLAWAFELTPEGVRRTPDGRTASDGPSADRSWAWVLAIAVLVAGSSYWAWGSARTGGIRPAGGDAVPSIAVLPFASLSPDTEDEYFAAGLSEELIHSLAHLGNLRVTARTSAFTLGDAGLEARQIADSLGVATILEGSVRRSAGRVRVTAQLIDAETGFELWSGRFERPEGEALSVQDSVVRAIVEALQVRLGTEERARVRLGVSAERPEDPAALDLYLRARHVWLGRDDPQRALELFRQAVDRQPTFARAWAGLADAYTILGSQGALPADEAHPAARAAAERALELDPDLGEAHASLGGVLADYYWDWEGADEELRRAVDLAPSYAPGHEWRAELLLRLGRFEEAIAAARRARRLDPLSEPARASLIHALRLAGRLEEAETEARRQRQTSPDYVPGHLNLGLVLLAMDRSREAVVELERLAGATGRSPVALSLLGVARARAGDASGAREILDELRTRDARTHVAPIHHALVLAALGEDAAALDALASGLEERHWLMGTLATDPLWDPLRDQRRFRELLERMGLPTDARPPRTAAAAAAVDQPPSSTTTRDTRAFSFRRQPPSPTVRSVSRGSSVPSTTKDPWEAPAAMSRGSGWTRPSSPSSSAIASL